MTNTINKLTYYNPECTIDRLQIINIVLIQYENFLVLFKSTKIFMIDNHFIVKNARIKKYYHGPQRGGIVPTPSPSTGSIPDGTPLYASLVGYQKH